jgi:hypothetical protein
MILLLINFQGIYWINSLVFCVIFLVNYYNVIVYCKTKKSVILSRCSLFVGILSQVLLALCEALTKQNLAILPFLKAGSGLLTILAFAGLLIPLLFAKDDQ